MKSFSATIRMQATEQYFPVLLCVMLYKAFLTFESMDETLQCYRSKEISSSVLCCGASFLVPVIKTNFKSFVHF